MNNKEEETYKIKFTKKGKRLGKLIDRMFRYWLKKSKLTLEDLKNINDVSKFEIKTTKDGFGAYYNGEMIGIGIIRGQENEAIAIFYTLCCKLDEINGNDICLDDDAFCFCSKGSKWIDTIRCPF